MRIYPGRHAAACNLSVNLCWLLILVFLPPVLDFMGGRGGDMWQPVMLHQATADRHMDALHLSLHHWAPNCGKTNLSAPHETPNPFHLYLLPPLLSLLLFDWCVSVHETPSIWGINMMGGWWLSPGCKTQHLNSDYASGLRWQGTNIDLHQTKMKFKGCDVISEEEEEEWQRKYFCR